MIRPTLETLQLTAGQECRLMIRLSNAGAQVCRGLVFRVRLPPELVALRGQERIDIGELLPGAFVDVRLLVRPAKPGAFLLVSTNFQYRDGYDRVVIAPQWRQEVDVQPAQLSPEQQALREAERHVQTQQWQLAWPLFLRASDARQALYCLQRAVQRLLNQRRPADAYAQYLAFARTVHLLDAPDLGDDPQLVHGLEQAVDWYARAGRADEARQCRDLVAYLIRSPVLDVRLVVPISAEFTVGALTSVAVEITNCGYGPARQVHLTLSGMIERPDDHELVDLQAGQSAVWNDVCVIPSHAGACAIRLDAVATPYGPAAPVKATWRGVVTAQPAGLLEQISWRQDASIHLEIENYATQGAVNLVNKDSVLINKAPLINDFSQRPTASAQSIANSDQTTCPSCGAPVEPAQKFCSQCGASMRPFQPL